MKTQALATTGVHKAFLALPYFHAVSIPRKKDGKQVLFPLILFYSEMKQENVLATQVEMKFSNYSICFMSLRKVQMFWQCIIKVVGLIPRECTGLC